MSRTISRPELWGIGQFMAGDEHVIRPVSHEEMDRDVDWGGQVFDIFALDRGSHVLVTSVLSEASLLWSLLLTCMSRGVVYSVADAAAPDAFRVAMFLQNFEFDAALGINGAVLDGLAELGLDPLDVLGRARKVAATPGAARRLESLHPHRWVPLGPTVAVECDARAGAHIDSAEWEVEERDGQILLTSSQPRALPLDRFETQVAGSVVRDECTCGRSSARIRT